MILKPVQSAVVKSQAGPGKSIYLLLVGCTLERSHPGATKFSRQDFSPHAPIVPDSPLQSSHFLPREPFLFRFRSLVSDPMFLSCPMVSRKTFSCPFSPRVYCTSTKVRAHVNRLGKRLRSPWMLRHYNNIATFSYFPRSKCILQQQSVIRGPGTRGD